VKTQKCCFLAGWTKICFQLMHHLKHILCTREVDESLINDAADKGVKIDVLPFIETQCIIDSGLKNRVLAFANQPLTVVFTSTNAVEAVVQLLDGQKPNWNIFCIANATQERVENYFGKTSIVSSSEYGLALANQILEYHRERQIEKAVFFCGNIRRDELPEVLMQNHIPLEELTVYNTSEKHHLVARDYDGILFFSPSAVNSFFNCNHVEENTVLFAIGNTTSNAIKKYSDNTLIVSSYPSKKVLVEEAVEFLTRSDFNNK
jgi:uroporphyrinogen-III synthase